MSLCNLFRITLETLKNPFHLGIVPIGKELGYMYEKSLLVVYVYDELLFSDYYYYFIYAIELCEYFIDVRTILYLLFEIVFKMYLCIKTAIMIQHFIVGIIIHTE